MTTHADIVWKPATELVELLRSRELSARDVAEAHLEQIDKTNPALNAMVTLTPDRAMASAAAADEAMARGETLGALHGLPIAHKDLTDTAGIRTTSGSPIFADRVPDKNALIVQRVVDAGAVTVGKSNTPEFGAGSQTFNQVFGVTLNPWDTNMTCGGSSGGAAVALAAGMVPLADGSDMGGSLRNPAAFCNVVGLRPSPGRVPAWPKMDAWSHLSTEGPMARTVDDVALLLAVQAGPDPRSPVALDGDPARYLPPVEVPASPLRIGWAPDLGGLPIDPAVRATLSGIPEIFAGLGHHVEAACPDLSDASEIFNTLRAASFALSLGELYETHRDQLKETIIWNVETGLNLGIEDHLRATRLRWALYERVVSWFEQFDVLVCPTTQVPPFVSGTEWITEVDGIEMKTYIEWMRACTDVTLMNCPAISVPGGFTESGLPVGLQIVTPPQRDDLALSVAKQFEQATMWGQRRPPAVDQPEA